MSNGGVYVPEDPNYYQQPSSFAGPPLPVKQVVDTSGGKGGVYAPEDPNYYQPTNDFVGPPLPDNYQAPIFYQQPQITPQTFNNTGRLVDSTLLAQQGILGRQPVAYEPIIQPSTYQNFYTNAQTMYPSVGGLLVPDYATKAQVFRQDFADAQAARDGEAGSVDGNAGDLGYDPNAAQNLAPVTTIDVNTGQVTNVDPGGTTASGMPGSTLGIGTVSDDPTGPESENGNGYTASTPAVSTPVGDYGNVTGTPLGPLGETGGIGSGVSVSPVGDYGSVVGTDLGLLGTNGGTGSGYGGGYAGDGVGAVGAAGGFAPGISGDSFGGEGDSADSAGGGGGAGGGGCVIATHAVAHGSFTPREKRKAVLWCTKTLHNRWWGETIRKGYRWHGNRAIAAGRAHEYYEEFRDFIRFATGAKRNTHTAKVFAWRSLQFFVTGLFLKG